MATRIRRRAQHLRVHVQFPWIQELKPNLGAALWTRPKPYGTAVTHDVLALENAFAKRRLVAPWTVYARLVLLYFIVSKIWGQTRGGEMVDA